MRKRYDEIKRSDLEESASAMRQRRRRSVFHLISKSPWSKSQDYVWNEHGYEQLTESNTRYLHTKNHRNKLLVPATTPADTASTAQRFRAHRPVHL